MNPTRFAIVAAAAGLGVGIGLVLRSAFIIPPVSPPAAPANTPAASAVPSPGLVDTDYSLTITAQRGRQYPARPMVVERAPKPAEGYRESLLSYQSDGLKIYAQALLPTAPKPAGGYPTVILIHGYVNPLVYQTDETFYSQFAAEYARRGFLVIKPDLRGYGRSWGEAEGAYYSAGYVTDVLNLSASLTNYSEANALEVGLIGHSMGGHVALTAALVRPDEFKALILAASSTGRQADMYHQWTANSDFGNPVTLGIRQRVISLFGSPSPDAPFWRQADPYRYLGDLVTPTQINHSIDDDTVPYHFSSDLTADLTAVGHAPAFETYDFGGHSFSGSSRPRLIDASAAFLTTHLDMEGTK